MRLSRLVTIGILIAAASCGSSSSGPTGTNNNPPMMSGAAANITIADFSFTPAVDTVKVGTTVQWMNNGPSEHSTTSDTGVWDSGGLTPGAMFQHTFNQTGSFPYHCTFHPPSLYPKFVGTIVVTN